MKKLLKSLQMEQERKLLCLLNFLTPRPHLPDGLSTSCMCLFNFPIQQRQLARVWLVGCMTSHSSGLPLLTKKECPNHFPSPFSWIQPTAPSSPDTSLRLKPG